MAVAKGQLSGIGVIPSAKLRFVDFVSVVNIIDIPINIEPKLSVFKVFKVGGSEGEISDQIDSLFFPWTKLQYFWHGTEFGVRRIFNHLELRSSETGYDVGLRSALFCANVLNYNLTSGMSTDGDICETNSGHNNFRPINLDR